MGRKNKRSKKTFSRTYSNENRGIRMDKEEQYRYSKKLVIDHYICKYEHKIESYLEMLKHLYIIRDHKKEVDKD